MIKINITKSHKKDLLQRGRAKVERNSYVCQYVRRGKRQENVGKEIFYVYYVIGPATCYHSRKLARNIQQDLLCPRQSHMPVCSGR